MVVRFLSSEARHAVIAEGCTEVGGGTEEAQEGNNEANATCSRLLCRRTRACVKEGENAKVVAYIRPLRMILRDQRRVLVTAVDDVDFTAITAKTQKSATAKRGNPASGSRAPSACCYSLKIIVKYICIPTFSRQDKAKKKIHLNRALRYLNFRSCGLVTRVLAR